MKSDLLIVSNFDNMKEKGKIEVLLFVLCKCNVKTKVYDLSARGNFMLKGKIKMILGAIFCLIVGGQFFVNGVREDQYLQQYSEAADVIVEANNFLCTKIKADQLTNKDSQTAVEKLNRYRAAVKASLQEFTAGKIFRHYEDEHAAVTELLKQETVMLNLTDSLLKEPRAKDAAEKLTELKDAIGKVKDISHKIFVKDAEFEIYNDLLYLHKELSRFVEIQQTGN